MQELILTFITTNHNCSINPISPLLHSGQQFSSCVVISPYVLVSVIRVYRNFAKHFIDFLTINVSNYIMDRINPVFEM